MRSVTRLAGSSLAEVKRTWFDQYGYNSRIIGYRFDCPVAADRLRQVRALIATAARPAERREIAPMLAAVAEALPSQDTGDAEAWMELVILVLGDYPADVIRESLVAIVKRAKWRPTPAEIREECSWIGERRLALTRLAACDGGVG